MSHKEIEEALLSGSAYFKAEDKAAFVKLVQG